MNLETCKCLDCDCEDIFKNGWCEPCFEEGCPELQE